MPASLGLLLPEFPPEKRGLAIGLWAAVGGTAAAAGPVIGGLLVELSWRWVFLVNLPVGIGAIVARRARAARDPRGGRARSRTSLSAGAADRERRDADRRRSSRARTGAGPTRACWRCSPPPSCWALPSRCAPARIAVPVVEPELLRVRAFAASNAAGVFFFIGFSAMLLGSVLWLTEVWHETALQRGPEDRAGPGVRRAVRGRGRDPVGPDRAADGRRGRRRAVRGWPACGGRRTSGSRSHYAADYLPGMLIGGMGVGLVNPALASAATAQLPPARLATGSAVLTMSRQFGSALGVALLVAVIGTPSPSEVESAFHDAWWMMTGAAALSALSFAARRAARAAPRRAWPRRSKRRSCRCRRRWSA